MTTLHTIQHRLFQLLVIAGAWYLFYAVWSHPELQLAGPILLWLVSHGAERLHDLRQGWKARQRPAKRAHARQALHAKGAGHPAFG
ncbi:hypothetical protein ACNHKD_09895 [Methylocystis sp. JAN1]|uniref:hypothetical protein n=1 Tax=Methylocystis sp. JAN1 TaxID=3397211 RepID=UPI003FA23B26